MVCCLLEQLRLLYPCFHGWDYAIDKNLGNTISRLKNWNLQDLNSKSKHWSDSSGSIEHVLHLLHGKQVRSALCQFHTLYPFIFKHVPHKTSCMQSGITMLKNKGICNGCSIKVLLHEVSKSLQIPSISMLYCGSREVNNYFVSECILCLKWIESPSNSQSHAWKYS